MHFFRKSIFLLSLIFAVLSAFSQQEKELKAVRVSDAPKIDGLFDDPAWEGVPIATNFQQFKPDPEGEASQKTEIRIVYDDNAIYIAAKMLDDPSLILTELGQRDEFDANTDRIAIIFDTFNDDQNGFGFFVTAAGVQMDIKFSNQGGGGRRGGEDSNWDAVWESDVKIVDDGWNAEFKIPYYNLRFPKTSVQDWGLNFVRVVRRTREETAWNPIDVNQNGFINQSGKLSGIENIEPPLRLSFTPFVSTNIGGSTGQKTQTSFNAGMDLKYGLNESFTLDMTLIPDFNNVRSDQQILNLGPFEQRFDENRAFFTEGVELFSKNDLFYSRRIGQRPINFGLADDNLSINEIVDENPSTTRLLNATKISGRTKKGFGVGVFNAFSEKSNARIIDTLTNTVRDVETNPFTNYNIISLDKTLKNASSINIINTNVSRAGDARDANVTGVGIRLNNKENSWGITGNFNLSQIITNDPVNEDSSGLVMPAVELERNNEVGFSTFVEVAKRSGELRYGGFNSIEDDKFDKNDLGILFSNNEWNYGGFVSYNKNEPTKLFQSFRIRSNLFNRSLYQPGESLTTRNRGIRSELNAFFLLKDFTSIFTGSRMSPTGNRDFFEPRTGGFNTFWQQPESYLFYLGVSSDFRKRFAIEARGKHEFSNSEDDFDFKEYGYRIEPRFRVNDKLNISTEFDFNYWPNNTGFVDNAEDDIIFGERDRKQQTLELNSTYKFDPNLNFNLEGRYTWDKGKYKEYYALQPEGNGLLNRTTSYSGVDDFNFSGFNIDAVLNWRFAPGSDASLTYKKQISDFTNVPESGFFNNFSNTLRANQSDIVNLKILYFLDYNTFRNSRKKKD